MPRDNLTDLVRMLLRRSGDGGAGFAVRLDWLDAEGAAVNHDFGQFTPSLERAVRRADSTRRYWLRGPFRPLAVTVVPIGRAAFRVHPHYCESSACPTTAGLLGMDPSAVNLPVRG